MGDGNEKQTNKNYPKRLLWPINREPFRHFLEAMINKMRAVFQSMVTGDFLKIY